MESEQASCSSLALNRIHFNDGRIRMLFHEGKEILVSSPFEAMLVNLVVSGDVLPSAESDLTWQIDVPDFKDALINELVQASL